MERVTLTANPRSVVRKKLKLLRRQSITPVHVYGPGVPSRSLQAGSQTLTKVLAQAGTNIPISLQIEGEASPVTVFVREIQSHPISEEVLHVDFYQVDVTQKMEVEVPIMVEGEAPAVRVLGGSLIQLMHTITVECLPLDVPEAIRVNVSSLDDFEKAIHVADLNLGAAVTVKADPEEVIAKVSAPRAEEVVPVAAATAEVEVVRVEKKEKEGEEETEGEEEKG